MPEQLQRWPGGIQAASKAETIGSDQRSMLQRLADLMTQGIDGGEPGPVDLAIAFPGVSQLLKTGPQRALRTLDGLAGKGTMVGGYGGVWDPQIGFSDYTSSGREAGINMAQILAQAYPRGSEMPGMRLKNPLDLIPTQPTVSKAGVQKYTEDLAGSLKSPRGNSNGYEYLPIEVQDFEGRGHLLDGHHRASAHLVRGEEVPVRSANLEEILAIYRKKHGQSPMYDQWVNYFSPK